MLGFGNLTSEKLFRLMMKTCGTTSPLDCLPKLLQLASEKCNLTEIQVDQSTSFSVSRLNYNFQRIVYSRRNFMEPGEQPRPHRYFFKEIQPSWPIIGAGKRRRPTLGPSSMPVQVKGIAFLLVSFFHRPAFTMGSIDGDCWHFFRLDGGYNCRWKPTLGNIPDFKRIAPDQKLELMMTDLDQSKMRIFDQKFSKNGLDCREVLQLQPFSSVSEVGHRQAVAGDEDGRLPLLSNRLLHERDHGGSKARKPWKSPELRQTQGP